MTNEEIARLKVLASSVNPADAWLANDDRSYDVAEVLRNFAPVMGELERVMAERDRAHAEGRAAGLREAQEACRGVVGRLLDLAMEGGGRIRCAEAFGDGDEYDADEEQCEFIAAGASLCGEAVEALMGVTQ